MGDEVMPTGGGVMRGLGAALGDLGGVFSAVEMVFAPNAARARKELERQRVIGQPVPSPADPPVLDPEARAGTRVVVYTWTTNRTEQAGDAG
jgi:hypothetical protein